MPSSQDQFKEAQLKIALSDANSASQRISSTSRYISFGVIATSFSLLVSSSNYSIEIVEQERQLLILSSIFGIITILFDYFHSFFYYLSSKKAIKNKAKEYKYNTKSFVYRTGQFFFYSKQFTSLIGAIILIYTIGSTLVLDP